MQDAQLQQAFRAHQAGNFPEAARLYAECLRTNARNPDALYLFGLLHEQAGQADGALRLFDRALSIKPGFADALYHRGNTLQQLQRLGEALVSYDRALQLAPASAELLNAKGVALARSGRALEALSCFEQATVSRPDYASAWNNCGNALLELQRYQEAIQRYERALSLQPDYAEAIHNRALALLGLQRLPEALDGFDRAIRAAPQYAEAHFHRGVALAGLGRNQEAVASFDTTLSLAPGMTDVFHHRGNAYLALDRLHEALTDFESVLSRQPGSAEALINKAVALSRLERYDEAIPFYDHALAADPRNLSGRYNRANTLAALKRFEEAISDCEAVLAADPDCSYARGILIYCRLQCCDWENLDEERKLIAAGLRDGKRVLNPQQNTAVSYSPADQLRCAELWVANESAPTAPLWRGERYCHERIRIAYLSADFHTHATAYLMAGLFEQHDRSGFEVYGVSFGPDDGGEMRRRLRGAFEHFLDVQQQSDAAIAALLRKQEIDIIVDLKGYTEGARAILARRVAPVQVNYLGFPGSMGADYVDYIIADPVVIPEPEALYYREKVVWLPDTYQCNDDKREIEPATPDRRECGLPENAFVFCSFNANYKITPETFDVWMRLLHQVENSVLWLFRSNDAAMKNLLREGEKRGIAPQRLVFASHCPLPQHLARHRLADLFLDTLPYGAHTTASDALWAGLPVLTCRGTTFAGRVAASLLQAVGMPELITENWESYEARALHFARNPTALAEVKARLAEKRGTAPLFDTRRFCGNLENAYGIMHERVQRGVPPKSFAVS